MLYSTYKNNESIEMFVGMLQDKTPRKKYEEEIIRQKELMKTIIDAVPDCIFYKDIDGKYIDCNNAFAKSYYKTNKEYIIGKNDIEIENLSSQENKDLIRSSMVNKIIAMDKQVIKNKSKQCSKIKIKYENNGAKYMRSIKVPLINKRGDVLGIVGVARDITETVVLENKLNKMSYKDKLTGLYNRAYFDEKLKILNSKKYLPLSLIMGDVNGLKVVNDTIGHLKGDELLVDIAKVIDKSCRKEDFVFSWAEDICNRIRQKCKENETSIIPLSIALGSSTKIDETKYIDEILTEAEDKVYRKKLLHGTSIKSFIIKSLQETLAQKYPQTEEHTNRVVRYARHLGEKLNLPNHKLNELILLAKLHDLGKIGIPDEILLKPGELNSSEFDIMKTHTEKGYRIAMSNPDIEHVAKGILTHHERYDGKVHLLGLKGDEIPFLARIICVVDSYDAMTNDRTYKNKISKQKAIKELVKYSGTQFAPYIIKVFLKELENV